MARTALTASLAGSRITTPIRPRRDELVGVGAGRLGLRQAVEPEHLRQLLKAWTRWPEVLLATGTEEVQSFPEPNSAEVGMVRAAPTYLEHQAAAERRGAAAP